MANANLHSTFYFTLQGSCNFRVAWCLAFEQAEENCKIKQLHKRHYISGPAPAVSTCIFFKKFLKKTQQPSIEILYRCCHLPSLFHEKWFPRTYSLLETSPVIKQLLSKLFLLSIYCVMLEYMLFLSKCLNTTFMDQQIIEKRCVFFSL